MGNLGWLLVGHALADFPLQGDFLAKAKNHRRPVAGVPWLACLAAHALICAGAVALVLPCQFAVAEFIVHLATDFAKNEGLLGPGAEGFAWDQLIHIAAKVVWWTLAGVL